MGDINYSDFNYRETPNMSWEGAASFPTVYRGREVIRPLDIPNIHPLIEDSPPHDNGIKFYSI